MCGEPLQEISRIPVCPRCLEAPEPLAADHFCIQCRTPFTSSYSLDDEGRCGLCRRSMNGFDAAYSFGSYEGKLRELIHLFKYGRIETLAAPLAGIALSAFPREERFDLIVPMPLHWTRRWRRGFNQAELLAREIGRRTGLPVKNAVRRRRATPSQARLSNSQRRSNMAGAFQGRSSVDLRGCRVLLVDDVLTTGATASACASAMKRAGAEYVAVLALSRTDRRYPAADGQAAAAIESPVVEST